MGISRGALALLADTLRDETRSGRAITYGVQSIDATAEEAMALLSGTGIRPAARAQGSGRIHQKALFEALGYGTVESIDVYPDEGPTHVLDLSRPVPDALHGRYDLVYDGGTMEHCFSPAEVLANCVRLLKPGARVIHHSPMNNWVDHGFYEFSPTLFFDFYAANGFESPALRLHFMDGRKESAIAYDPRIDGPLPYGLGGSAKVLAFFTARKAHAAAQIVFPIQGRYRATFGGEQAAARRKPTGALERLKRSWRKRTFRLRAKSL